MNKDEMLEAVKSMSVLELSELVKALEEEFGDINTDLGFSVFCHMSKN